VAVCEKSTCGFVDGQVFQLGLACVYGPKGLSFSL
jgi:hypothetical protein